MRRYRLQDEAIVQHFTAVADSSPIPIVIYNGIASGINIGIPTLMKLAQHPNIAGVKDGDVRKIAATIAKVKENQLDFEVLVSTAGYLLPAIQSGSCGGTIGLASALGQEVCDLYELTQQQRWKEAIDLHVRITKADTTILSELGISGLKAAMDIMGLYGGPCRRPLLNPSSSDVARIKKLLIDEGFVKG